MAFPDLSKAFNGKNVSLLLTDSGLDEVLTMYNMRKKKITPRNRIDTRGGTADFASSQLLEITFESVVSKLLYEYLDTNSNLNARTVLPTIAMKIIAESQDGTIVESVPIHDVQEVFSAQIWELEDLSIDGSYWWIQVKMITINGTRTISDIPAP